MTKPARHPSQRPPQFNRRSPIATPLELVPSICTRRDPCGVCDRCEYEMSASSAYVDHPAMIATFKEATHL